MHEARKGNVLGGVPLEKVHGSLCFKLHLKLDHVDTNRLIPRMPTNALRCII